MYQYTCLINGETIQYSLYHRGRAGTDTLQVNLYSANGTSKMAVLQTIGTDSSAWKQYTGFHTVTVPSGIYQLSFESLFNFGGKPHEGSLLDEVDIAMAPLVTFSKPIYSQLEDSASIPWIKVNGKVPVGGMVVSITASSIGATLGKDYTFANTVTIPQGIYTPQSDSFPLAFTVLSDQIKENDEKIVFTLQSATNGGLLHAGCGGYLSSTYTILNDDQFEAGPKHIVCPQEIIRLNAVGGESPTWNRGVMQAVSFPVPALPGDYLYIAKDTSYSEPIGGVPYFLPMADTVLVTVKPAPVAPNVSNARYCLHEVAQPLTTLADSLFWYTVAVGGSPTSVMPVANTNAVGVTFHWVSKVEDRCEGPRSNLTVTVNDLPMVKIGGISSGNYCSKSSLVLSAIGASQYDWKLPSGLHTTQQVVPISSFGTTDTGKYLLVGTDANLCAAKDSVLLALKNPPAVSADPVSVCEKAPIQIQATTTGTAYWRLPNKTIQNSSNLFIPNSTYSHNGRYVVISTQDGCTDSLEVLIVVSNCRPLARDDFYSIYTDEKLVVESNNHPINNDTDPNDQLQFQDLAILTSPLLGNLTLSSDGFFSYSPINGTEGKEVIEYQICDRGTPPLCAKAKIEIEIKKRNAFFPDAFTPNGDGINDTYTVYQVAPGLKVELDIYNRWGDLVFQDQDYKNDWKGTCSGTMCNGNGYLPVGTYYIVAKLSNGDVHSTYLTLNR